MNYNRTKLEEKFELNKWIPFFRLKELLFYYKIDEVKTNRTIDYIVNLKSKNHKSELFNGYATTIKFTGKQTNQDFITYVYLLFETIIEQQFNVPKSLSKIAFSESIEYELFYLNKIILTNLRTSGYFQSNKTSFYYLDDTLIISFEENKYKNSIICFVIKYEKDSISIYRHGLISQSVDDLYRTNVLANMLIKNDVLKKEDDLILELISE